MIRKLVNLELKYLLKKKTNLFLLTFSVILGFFTGFFFLNGIMADRIHEDGSIEIIKGREAIELVAKYNRVYQGEITTEKLQKSREVYNNSWDLSKEKTIYTPELFQVSQIHGVMSGLRYTLKDDMVIVPWKERNIPAEYADDYYGLRKEMIHKYTETLKDNKVSEKIMELESKIEAPFYYYENASNWGDAIEWLTMLMVIIMGVTIIVSSTALSETVSSGTKDVILRTVDGNRKFIKSRAIAIWIINTLIFVAPTGIYLFMIYRGLGSTGLKTTFQCYTPFTPVKHTLGTNILLEILGGYLGIIAMSSLSLLISSGSKNSSNAISISIGLFFVYLIIAIFIRPASKIINVLIAISPAGISQIFYEIPSYKFVNILGFVIWLPYLMLFMGVVQTILYYFGVGRTYKR